MDKKLKCVKEKLINGSINEEDTYFIYTIDDNGKIISHAGWHNFEEYDVEHNKFIFSLGQEDGIPKDYVEYSVEEIFKIEIASLDYI